MEEVYNQMLKLNPTTLEGYRALGACLDYHGSGIAQTGSGCNGA